MKKPSFLKHYNWRLLLMRILLDGITLCLVALILPNIKFMTINLGNILLLTAAIGILNALIKPIIQLLTLSLIFATYGIVIVLINSVILLLLAAIFPDRFAVSSFAAALLGGLLFGALSSFLEAVFGLTVPIVPESETELRTRLETRTPVTRQIVSWAESEKGQALSEKATISTDEQEPALAEIMPGQIVSDPVAAEPASTQPEPAALTAQTTEEEEAL